MRRSSFVCVLCVAPELLAAEVAEGPAPAQPSAAAEAGPAGAAEVAAPPSDPPSPAPGDVVVRERVAAPEPSPEPPAGPPAAPSPGPEPGHRPPPTPERDLPEPPAAAGAPHHELAVELDLALNTRLGTTGSYTDEQRLGAAYGVGAWLSLAGPVALGLELTRTELGRGSSDEPPDLVDVDYAATTLWASGRFEPWRAADVVPFVALRAGAALQHVDARGLRQAQNVLSPARTYGCSETEGPGLALGAGVGAALRLGRHVRLVARGDANAQRLEGGWLGDCAAGLGSIVSVAVGLGLAYGFEI